MNEYEKYIALSRYARFLPEHNRRESWEETVSRYIYYFKEKIGKNKAIPYSDISDAIIAREVFPSMRCLMTAGEALERDNVAGYNCSYIPIDNTRAFDEIMYILMCGTGVGFSVERQYIGKLPEVAESFHDTNTTIRVSDSKIGWARSTKELIALLYQGQVPKWDLSAVRPSGSRLVTFGGRASGPEPLEDLFRFAVHLFSQSAGRRLNSLECHDLVCKIADVVVCGGVRRSALISLSNLTDERMRYAKQGEWHVPHPQRALANNSIALTEKPDVGIFLREWEALYTSQAGERGLFSRPAAEASIPSRRENGYEWGTNPCSEIILRPNEFCNLSEIACRPHDSDKDLADKIRLATILGTMQSTLTNFRYLSKKWQRNTEEERLLGVSMTGIMDHEKLREISDENAKRLNDCKALSIQTNQEVARSLGIPESAAITCVKPSGTVSQLAGTSSGIHPRYSRYYRRRVRADAKDPLAHFMIDKGMPYEQDFYNPNAVVFSFPVKAPEEAVLVSDTSALDQLTLVDFYNKHYAEHKVSVTVYVKEDEWLDVGAYVYRHLDTISGVSFLPHDSGTYRQAPYEKIDEESFAKLKTSIPEIDYTEYTETEDNTIGSQELACTGGACEL